MDKNCNKKHYPWNFDVNKLPKIDEKTLLAIKPFPKCIYCNSIARPNVSFFNDHFFNEKNCKIQSNNLLNWLELNKNNNLIILEIGCGVSKHSIRFKLKNDQYTMLSNEWKLPKHFLSNNKTKLIRINPDNTDEEDGVIHFNLGALSGLKLLCK